MPSSPNFQVRVSPSLAAGNKSLRIRRWNPRIRLNGGREGETSNVIQTAHQPSQWTWQTRAACRGLDAELFFPTPQDDPAHAKEICEACPVRIACLSFSIEHGERYGIWGGLTERERAHLDTTEKEAVLDAGRKARELPAA